MKPRRKREMPLAAARLLWWDSKRVAIIEKFRRMHNALRKKPDAREGA